MNETNEIEGMYTEDIAILDMSTSKIKEITKNTYNIDMSGLMFVSGMTKIYVGNRSDDYEITCIRKKGVSGSIDYIEAVDMINNGIIILNNHIFNEGDYLQIVLNKKLEDNKITIFKCRRLITGTLRKM